MRIAAVFLLLAACVEPSVPSSGATPMQSDSSRVKPSVEQPMMPDAAPAADQALSDACGASRVQDLIGKARTPALEADAARRSGARAVRAHAQGDMVTMDFSETRLNIETDAAGRVVRLSCG